MAYNDAWYTPANLLSKTVPQSEIRKEYTRLRDIAQKRIKRLGESEFRTGRTYRKYKTGFPKLSQIKNETELAYAMAELQKFVKSNITVRRIREIRRKQLKTLKTHKYNFVNEENFQDFSEFMEDYKDNVIDKKQIGSPILAEVFYEVERLGLDPEKISKDFDFWLNNREILKEMTPSRGKSYGSISAMKKKINSQLKRISKRQQRRRT